MCARTSLLKEVRITVFILVPLYQLFLFSIYSFAESGVPLLQLHHRPLFSSVQYFLLYLLFRRIPSAVLLIEFLHSLSDILRRPFPVPGAPLL